MLTLEDCVALSDLTKAEIAAIAIHDHVSDIVASALGNYMLHLPGGVKAIKAIIRDDIAAAQARGDDFECAKLKLVLQKFIEHHSAATC